MSQCPQHPATEGIQGTFGATVGATLCGETATRSYDSQGDRHSLQQRDVSANSGSVMTWQADVRVAVHDLRHLAGGRGI